MKRYSGTLTQDCTITVLLSNDQDIELLLTQGGAGSYTVTWEGVDVWLSQDGSPPVLRTTVGASDLIQLSKVGGTVYGVQLAGKLTPSANSLALTEAPANQSYTGMTVSMIYGESLVPGDLVYFKSDGKVWKADANVVGLYPVMGLALETAASGAHLVLLHGIYRDDTRYAFTVGGVVYLSIFAGVETQVQPTDIDNVIQVVGVATHADRIYFNPQLDYITHV